jgi:hypothetical protein
MENFHSATLISWQKHKHVMMAILCTDGEALTEDGGITATIKLRNGIEVVVNNSQAVPHCFLLSKMFTAHINVECCTSVKLSNISANI